MKRIFSISCFFILVVSFAQNDEVERMNQKLQDSTVKISVEPDILKCYLGSYFLKTEAMELSVKIVLDDNKLFYEEKRGERTFKAELHSISKTKFKFKENEAIVQFNTTTTSYTPSFTITINGDSYTCIKLE